MDNRTATAPVNELDVVIVGAGFAGLYALYKLRELGFRARVFDTAAGVGGTWYWNRYPGARCDIPSLEYSYSFSPELEQEWEWTEFFPAQDEIERYLNHVADRFGLRADLELGTTITGAELDETTNRWLVTTEAGAQWSARYVIMATGCLSVPTRPELPGLETFAGRVLQTSMWPDQVDLTGARIALIGTGSSGVQATPPLAEVADHLYVFQRTATYCWPSRNAPLDPRVQADVKARYREMRQAQRTSMAGVSGFDGVPILDMARPGHPILGATDEEVAAAMEEFGFGACRVWSDSASDPVANERAAELYREMVRRTVRDPETAEELSPRGFPLGCKRPVLDVGYFESFNRDNVSLVGLRHGDIQRVTPTGIETAGGHVAVDVVVFATGFDAMTGALTRIDIRGRGGRLLREEWSDGPGALLGLGIAGYPNLFTITGPGSPSVLSNMVPGVEQHVEWVADCLVYLRQRDLTTIEATEEAQQAWVEKVNRAAQGTMFVAEGCNSWYLGANVPGKPRVFMPYVGGFGPYVAECEEVAGAGYRGFALS